ncbi:MAG: DUF3127 domain-containing protein [Bacteroidetes bacterium]|nr:MAG: DUF3127 domain-containing protein [Bacteroidota bacterium]TAE60659.1 MAG: DUF3127 domain-containing protein [Bacteroidota bacterium]TAF92369.1 MAG: DUF3127 domain-containing protein [Bacteroidota bacterium]
MSFEIEGKLIFVGDEAQKTPTFKVREFVIEESKDLNGRLLLNYVKFQCSNDRTAIVTKAKLGDTVKVSFNIRGTKYNKNGMDNYITNLDAWRLELVSMSTQNGTPAAMPEPANFPPPPVDFEDDGLPF